MTNLSLKIAVCSLSFSKNESLRQTLNLAYSNTVFNETGQLIQGQALREFICDADVVIAGTEAFTLDVLEGAKALKLISKYGVGLDNIDFDACEKLGIEVRSKQGVNKLSVAEMTVGFMVSLCRNLYTSSITLKRGQWVKNGGMQLSGKTVGIIGVGHIGKEVIRLLQPFGCRILVNDIVDQDDYYQQNQLTYVDKETLIAESDIVTVHTDLNDESRHMMDASVFERMKKTAFFINTARGELVVQSDLKNALIHNLISGAAIDVYETEPEIDRELLEIPSLFCTPHIGGNAVEAVEAMGLAAIEAVLSFFDEN